MISWLGYFYGEDVVGLFSVYISDSFFYSSTDWSTGYAFAGTLLKGLVLLRLENGLN